VNGPTAKNDLQGKRVIITSGRHQGEEGVCLGRTADGLRWAISPDGADDILALEFEKEFGLLVDLSSNPELN
jgi:hypothetical protein